MASFVRASKLVDLLTAADPKKSMYVRVLSSNRLAVGIDPIKPSAVIDLSEEAVVPYADTNGNGQRDILRTNPDLRETAGIRASRRGGDYWFEIRGRRTAYHSLKELLSGGLLAVESVKSGTLEKLSHVKPRSRRIVARDPKLLFDKVHLAKDYAEKLTDGWFYGTNNSANETNTWLERACIAAGLKWGEEFKTSLTFRIEDL
jgi:hypothetical protein